MAVQVAVLGSLEVWVDGCLVDIPRGNQRSLLSLLALHAPGLIAGEVAAEALWPDQPPGRASRSLQVTVSRLRNSLGAAGAVVQTVSSGYRLAVERESIDAYRFEQLVRDGEDARRGGDPVGAHALLDQALALWRGPPLGDVAFEPFAQAEAARLEELRVAALEERFETDLAAGRHRFAVGDLETLVGEYPARERLLGQLMLALYRCGRQSDALGAAREGRRRLDDDLGLQLSPVLRDLEQRILQQDPSLDAAAQDEPAPAIRHATMPSPPAALVGRREDLRTLETLLTGRAARLVTVSGPGGVGKTRLAIELGHRLQHGFEAGAGFVSLAELAPGADLVGANDGDPRARDVGDEQLVVARIAQALGCKERPGQPLMASLVGFLEHRDMLLVLDNFEHVMAATGVVSALLSACAALRIVVTSREALRVAGEHEYPLEPLALPDVADDDPVRVASSDAVALFVERARAVDPRFLLSEDNARAVSNICVRLDGLPLALELAAARLKALSPQAMLARLDRRLPLLTGGARSSPERQQTLEATVAWSYALLGEEEQGLFARLAVFRGGFTLEAAERVCDAGFDVVCSLIDKSLLRQRDDRISMLETIRAFAQDRLTTSTDQGTVGRRHAEWMMAVVAQAEPQLYGIDQSLWMHRLDLERDNLRGALEFARSDGDDSLQCRLLAGCWYFWYLRSCYAEGQAQLEAALPALPTAPPELRRDLLNALFVIHWYRGNSERAAAYAAESLRLRDSLPEGPGLFRSLINAAVAASESDPATAAALLQECTTRASRTDAPWCAGMALANLSDLALRAGAYADAATHAAEATRIFDPVGDGNGHAMALVNLAAAELELGDTTAAIEHFGQALREVPGDLLPDSYYLSDCVDGLAAATASQGRAAEAACLLGINDAITARTGFAQQGFEQTRRQRTLATIASQLDPKATAHHRARGTDFSIAEAVQHVLDAASPPGAGEAAQPVSALNAGPTRR